MKKIKFNWLEFKAILKYECARRGISMSSLLQEKTLHKMWINVRMSYDSEQASLKDIRIIKALLVEVDREGELVGLCKMQRENKSR